MAAAGIAAGIVDQCTAARDVSCDMLLVCNWLEAVGELLTNWQPVLDPLRARRIDRLLPATTALDWPSLQQAPS